MLADLTSKFISGKANLFWRGSVVLWLLQRGWSGGAMVFGVRPVRGRPSNFVYRRVRATALAVGAGGGCLDLILIYHTVSKGS